MKPGMKPVGSILSLEERSHDESLNAKDSEFYLFWILTAELVIRCT